MIPNPIEWALDLLSKATLPPGTEPAEFAERMDQLRALGKNGLADEVFKCSDSRCGYFCEDQARLCPLHQRPMVPVTWKQLAMQAFSAAHSQAVELSGQVDEVLFRAATESEELDQLRHIMDGPIGRFAGRMDRYSREHDESDLLEQHILGRIHSDLDRLKLAMGRNNRLLVGELAVGMATILMKLTQP